MIGPGPPLTSSPPVNEHGSHRAPALPAGVMAQTPGDGGPRHGSGDATTFPSIVLTDGTVCFDAASGELSITALPIAIRFGPDEPPAPILPVSGESPARCHIRVQMMPGGAAASMPGVADLLVVGRVTDDAGMTLAGTLLTGEVLGLSVGDTTSSMVELDAYFAPTSGALLGLYGDGAGAQVLVRETDFDGFDADFEGTASGVVSPIDPCALGLGGDANDNGIADACEDCVTPFIACGELIDVDGCAFLRTADGRRYSIDADVPFGPGTELFVRGCLDATQVCFNTPCVSFSLFAEGALAGCIAPELIAPCFAGCGMLIDSTEGLVFEDNDARRWRLDDVGPFLPGERLWVSGGIDATCDPTTPGIAGCLAGNVTAACLESCGMIATEGPCTIFVADDGRRFRLDEADPLDLVATPGAIGGDGQFAGDLLETDVWITAGYDAACDTACDNVTGCLRDAQMGQCFEACGELGTLAGCHILTTANATLFVVENVAGFVPGERIEVRGCLDPTCLLACDTAFVGGFGGCITDNTVAPCCATCPGDLNGDGLVNGADLQPFNICFQDAPFILAGCGCGDVFPVDAPDGLLTPDDASRMTILILIGASCDAPVVDRVFDDAIAPQDKQQLSEYKRWPSR